MTPFIAEFIGTAVLILLGNGVVANVLLKKTTGNNGGWIVITTGWALAVYVAVVITSPYSGAHLNPAVTIGLAAAGVFEWSSVALYITAQMLGAMTGAFFVWLLYKDHYDQTEDADAKKATFCNAPLIRNFHRNFLTEAVATFVLVFTILYFTDATITEPETVIGLGSLGAIPVAFLVWSIGLSLGGPTGYAINPARDLGPRIVHAFLPIKNKALSDWSYSWIPVAGPIFGAVVAALLLLLLT